MRTFKLFLSSINITLGLTPTFIRFLWMNFCFTAFIMFNGIFINVFIVRATGEQRQVMVFNIILAVIQPLSMLLSVRLMRRLSPIRTQRIGLLLYFAVFLFLLVFLESAAEYIHIVAGALSVAAGFYYTTYIIQMMRYTSDNDRDAAQGALGTTSNLLALIIPLISGYIISLFNGFEGYRLLFVICMAISGLAIYLTTRLTAIPSDDNKDKVRYRQLIKLSFLEPGFRSAMLSTFIQGLYAGTMSFFLTILLYGLTNNEALVGVNSFVNGLIGIVVSIIYMRYIRPSNRVRVMLISVLGILGVTALLYLYMSTAVLFLYSIGITIAGPFFSNPPLVLYMGVVQAGPQTKDHSAQVHATREFFYAAGRAAGIFLALILPQTNTGSVTVIMILLAAQLINVLLCRQMRSVITVCAEHTAEHR